jgi:hypothetical protein
VSGLLSLRPSHLFADPAGSATVVVDSLVRNVTAEAWFYGQFVAAVALGLAIDLLRRRDLKARYLSRSVRLDALYGLLEFVHVVLRPDASGRPGDRSRTAGLGALAGGHGPWPNCRPGASC